MRSWLTMVALANAATDMSRRTTKQGHRRGSHRLHRRGSLLRRRGERLALREVPSRPARTTTGAPAFSLRSCVRAEEGQPLTLLIVLRSRISALPRV